MWYLLNISLAESSESSFVEEKPEEGFDGKDVIVEDRHFLINYNVLVKFDKKNGVKYIGRIEEISQQLS